MIPLLWQSGKGKITEEDQISGCQGTREGRRFHHSGGGNCFVSWLWWYVVGRRVAPKHVHTLIPENLCVCEHCKVKGTLQTELKLLISWPYNTEIIPDYWGGLNIITRPLKVEEGGRTVDKTDVPWKERQEKFEVWEGPNHSWLLSCTEWLGPESSL